ncbi:MAG: CZB domain-containing protein [Rhodospirillaceae bacterium]
MSTNFEAFEVEIENAIRAHALWKVQLENCFQTKTSFITTEEAASDRTCSLGRWLYSKSIPREVLDSAQYRLVCELHVSFHLKAAEALKIALQTDEAAIDSFSFSIQNYETASSMLINALLSMADFHWIDIGDGVAAEPSCQNHLECGCVRLPH